MNLPDNVDKLAAGFTKLSDSRKAEVIEHLRASQGARGQAVVAQLIANGGPEGEFVQHLFGKEVPGPTDAPVNKKLNPPNTK